MDRSSILVPEGSLMTGEQRKYGSPVRGNLVNIIFFDVCHGVKGSDRRRFAQIFLMESMQKIGLFQPGPLPKLS